MVLYRFGGILYPLATFESGGEAPDARLEVEEEHEGDRDRDGRAVHAADVNLKVIQGFRENDTLLTVL